MENQAANIQTEGQTVIPADQILRTRGYTGRFQFLSSAGMGWLAYRDLSGKGSRHILVYFGLESIGWTWFWLISGAFLTFWLASRIAFNFYFLRVVKHYKDSSPIDPTEVGVLDIQYWSSVVIYITTLLLFGLAPGKFGLLRPPAIVVTSIIFATVLSALWVKKAVRAIYGPSKVRKSISRKQCDMIYAKDARCENWAFRSKFRGRRPRGSEPPQNFCRWHYIAIATEQDHRRRPRVVLKQYQAFACLMFSALGIWNFASSRGIVWIMLFVFALGAAIKYLSESIIVPWLAISKLAVWARILAVAFAFQIVAGITILVLVGKSPRDIEPLVAYFSNAKAWLAFGPAIVYLMATLLTVFAFDALIKRILFYSMSSFAPMFALPTLLPIWNMFASALRQYHPFGYWIGEEFWKATIGGDVKKVWGIAFLAGLLSAHAMLLRRKKTNQAAEAAYLALMTGILGSALVVFLSMVASRYLLHGFGVTGPVLFIATTVALSSAASFSLVLLAKLIRQLGDASAVQKKDAEQVE